MRIATTQDFFDGAGLPDVLQFALEKSCLDAESHRIGWKRMLQKCQFQTKGSGRGKKPWQQLLREDLPGRRQSFLRGRFKQCIMSISHFKQSFFGPTRRAGVDGKSLREAAQQGEIDIAVMVLNQPSWRLKTT